MEAGEEVATTDATVDILVENFEEVKLVIFEEELPTDVLDVDVSLEALLEDESIEAIGPTFYNQVTDSMFTSLLCIINFRL